MAGGKRRMVLGASALALWAAMLTVGGARPAAAAAPGGPYHFEPGGVTRILDTRNSGLLVAGSTTAVPANSYLNFRALDPEGAGVVLTFAPCGGGASRTLALSDDSPSLFFTRDATCMTPDVTTGLLVDRVATEGPVDDTGLRYVRIPDEPTLVDADGPDQPLTSGQRVLDLGSWVPPDAEGIAVEIWAVNDERAVGVAVDPCSQTPGPTQVVTGTIGFGDINVAHMQFRFDQSTCLRVDLGTGHDTDPRGTYVNVKLLGYFTDGLAAGGDTPPSYESRSELRPGLVPREPVRVLDTRSAVGAPAGKVAAGGTVALDLSGQLTPDTAAVTLNVTATDPDADGYVTVYPCADGTPDSSNLNYRRGADVPNLVIVEPDIDGRVCLFTSAPAHLLADLGGTYEWNGGMGYRAEGPRRLLDTRNGTGAPAGAVAAGSTTRLAIRTAAGEIPAAATVNLTAVGAGGYGYVTAYPCDQARPEVSNLNYVAGQTVAALSTVKLSAAGELCLYSFGSTHLLADLAGTYAASATGRLLLGFPTRWFDSRQEGISDAETVWEFGLGPFAASAAAVIANLTATGVQEPGFFTGFDCGPDLPNASNLNYVPGTDVANLAFVPIGPGQYSDLTFCLYNSGTTHELIDVFGWITSDLAWSTIRVGREP